jgi:hypothetical protein
MEEIQRNLVATIMEIVIPSTEILSTTTEHIRDHCNSKKFSGNYNGDSDLSLSL